VSVDTVSVAVGVALGLSLAAPPGPMNAVIAEETVVHGWSAGVRTGMGALVSDAVFCALAFAGALAVGDSPTVRGGMAIVGGFLLLYFAVEAVRGADEPAQEPYGFKKALAVGLTNPYQIGWWLTAGVALVHPSTVEVLGVEVVAGGLSILVGFFGGIGLWVLWFPALLVGAGGHIDGFERGVAYVSALVLVGFGVGFFYYSATLLV